MAGSFQIKFFFRFSHKNISLLFCDLKILGLESLLMSFDFPFFTEKKYLLELHKIKISEYYQNGPIQEEPVEFLSFFLFTLFRKLLDNRTTSPGLLILFDLDRFNKLTNHRFFGRGAFLTNALSQFFPYLSCLLF